jgi:hypothetical protein
MLTKAYTLMKKGRVEYIGDGVYNVVGDHGTYIVATRIDGTVNCSCLGFLGRKRCSHSLAVLMLNTPSLLKSVKDQIRKLANTNEHI